MSPKAFKGYLTSVIISATITTGTDPGTFAADLANTLPQGMALRLALMPPKPEIFEQGRDWHGRTGYAADGAADSMVCFGQLVWTASHPTPGITDPDTKATAVDDAFTALIRHWKAHPPKDMLEISGLPVTADIFATALSTSVGEYFTTRHDVLLDGLLAPQSWPNPSS